MDQTLSTIDLYKLFFLKGKKLIICFLFPSYSSAILKYTISGFCSFYSTNFTSVSAAEITISGIAPVHTSLLSSVNQLYRRHKKSIPEKSKQKCLLCLCEYQDYFWRSEARFSSTSSLALQSNGSSPMYKSRIDRHNNLLCMLPTSFPSTAK